MATISRGHSFGAADKAYAADFNSLISQAKVTDLTLNDFTVSIGQQLGRDTAPTTAGRGWVTLTWEHMFPSVGTGTTCTDMRYMIRAGSNGTQNNVCLWSQYGLETKRYVYSVADAVRPGAAMLPVQLTGDAATLTTTYAVGAGAGAPTHEYLGTLLGTAHTGGSEGSPAYNNRRLVIQGPGIIQVDKLIDTALNRAYFWRQVTGAGAWHHGVNYTNTDKVFVLGLNPALTGDRQVPAWLLGAPLWRA